MRSGAGVRARVHALGDQDRERGARADEREQRQRERSGRMRHDHREHRDAGARAHADERGIGERVAHDRLHQRARARERRADQRGADDARQPHVEQHVVLRMGGIDERRAELADRDLDRARGERERRHREPRRAEQHRPERGPRREPAVAGPHAQPEADHRAGAAGARASAASASAARGSSSPGFATNSSGDSTCTPRVAERPEAGPARRCPTSASRARSGSARDRRAPRARRAAGFSVARCSELTSTKPGHALVALQVGAEILEVELVEQAADPRAARHDLERSRRAEQREHGDPLGERLLLDARARLRHARRERRLGAELARRTRAGRRACRRPTSCRSARPCRRTGRAPSRAVR